MGRGIVEADCASHVGSGGVIAGPVAIKATQEADLVLAIGCKFSTWTPINKPPKYPVPQGQQIIQIDIDYQALGKNTPISTGLVGDARETLALLNRALDGRNLNADEGWVRSLSDDYQAYRAQVNGIADARYTDEKQIYNLAYACRAVAGLLPEDAIIAVDGGQTCEWAHTFIHPKHPQNILGTPGMGHLGCGLPFAIAAKLAHPESPVVCVTGDGSLGLNIQELETAVRYGTPVVTFVMNDSHWGMYRPVGEMLYGNTNFGTALTPMNYGRIAEGFGCYGEQVTDLEQLPAAYRRALDSGRPAVIDIPVDFTFHPIDEFWGDVVLHGIRFPALQQGA
jgi:acetolactate synthase-1/2/3 large subunit